MFRKSLSFILLLIFLESSFLRQIQKLSVLIIVPNFFGQLNSYFQGVRLSTINDVYILNCRNSNLIDVVQFFTLGTPNRFSLLKQDQHWPKPTLYHLLQLYLASFYNKSCYNDNVMCNMFSLQFCMFQFLHFDLKSLHSTS